MSAIERERVNLVSAKDLEISYFCGSGAGGQARNKVASGVLIKHPESGASGRASDSRSQHENRTNAFKRMAATAAFKFWCSKKIYELRQRETMEQTVERELRPENLRIEIKGEDGRWKEVTEAELDATEKGPQ